MKPDPLTTLTAPTSRPGLASRLLPALATLAGLCLLMPPALADSGSAMPRQILPAYQQECAACHLAYPPGMLPAPSWNRIMGGLERHYGTDASLDEASVRQIGAWLQTHAGSYKRVSSVAPPQDRITRSPWFERKHRELDPTIWKQGAVKSAANCMACHSGAEKGRFDDDELRFPAGLDARYRRNWEQD